MADDDYEDAKTLARLDEPELPVGDVGDVPGLASLLERNIRGELYQLGPGMIIDGKWELRRLLGEGAFGQVYEAWHLKLDHPVAIKILVGTHDNAKQRFLEEAQLMAGMSSEHLVRASDYGELPNGSPYLVMDLVPGKSLRHWLGKERMPMWRAVRIGAEIVEGLVEVHERGVVHGDIKPENVVIGEDDDKARLLDFGLAQTSAMKAELRGGTPHYMAPEMLLEKAPASERGDLYAVGVVLYEMLTGRLPRGHLEMKDLFEIQAAWKRKPTPTPVRMYCKNVPKAQRDALAALERLVMAALARDPTVRPKSAMTMLEELRRLQERLSPEARAPGESERATAPSRAKTTRSFVVSAIAGLMFISLVAFAVVLEWRPESVVDEVLEDPPAGGVRELHPMSGEALPVNTNAVDDEESQPSDAPESAKLEPNELTRDAPSPKLPASRLIRVPLGRAEVVEATRCDMNSNTFGFDPNGVLHFELISAGNVVQSCAGASWRLSANWLDHVAWSFDRDGNLHAAWSSAHGDAHSIVVAKLDAGGRVVWEVPIPTGQTVAHPMFVRVGVGGTYVVGETRGQLIGKPLAAKGKPWVARVSDAGALEWTRQQPFEHEQWEVVDAANASLLQRAMVDAAGNLYLLYGGFVDNWLTQKIDALGEQIWLAKHRRSHLLNGHARVANDGSAIYYAGSGTDHGGNAHVTKLDGKGLLLWTKTYELRNKEVIDDVEGTTWSVAALSDATIALNEDSLAIIGTCQNWYENGAAPPPKYRSAWVIWADLDGEVRSSQNFRVAPLEVIPGQSGSSASFLPQQAVLLTNGELRIAGQHFKQITSGGDEPGKWLLVTLSRKTE